MEQSNTQSRVAAWLLGFKGPRGKCARLEQVTAELADVRGGAAIPYGHSGIGRSPSGTASDPTGRAALAMMHRAEQLEAEASDISDEIGAAMELLARCPFGDTLSDYYLEPDGGITWASLANEDGVSTRAILKRRAAALEWLSVNWTLQS